MKKFKALILALILSVSFSFPAFAGELTFPFFCWYDSSGYPLASGKLYSYVSGTSTEKLLYSDKTTTTPHTNPEILDTNGCTEIYGLGTYTLTLKDSTDTTTYFSIDDVVAGGQGGSVSYHYPNYGAVDNCATGNNDTIKYAIDTCSTDACTIYLANNSGSARTEYVCDTDETAGSTIKFVFEEGAELKPASGDTLTVYSAAHIRAGPTQQIIDLANNSTNPLLFTTVAGITETGWFGPAGDDSTDDLNALQAAITAGAGGKIHIPNPASKYKITDELDIATANTILYGDSMTDTIIRQDTWEQPAIEIRTADGAQVRNLYVQTTDAKASISGTVDSEPARDYNAGIYVADSDNVIIDSVTTDGFVMGIRLRGETDNTNLSANVRVNNIHGKGHDMGILAMLLKDFIITNCLFVDNTVSQGIVIHAIYFTNGSANVQCEGGTIDNIATSLTTLLSAQADSAFAFKYLHGTTISNLAVRRWPAWGYITGSEGVVLNNITVVDIDGYVHSSVLIGANTVKTRMTNVFLQSDQNNAVYLQVRSQYELDATHYSYDNVVSGLTIIDNGSTTPGNDLIWLQGERNEISDVYIKTDVVRPVMQISGLADKATARNFRTAGTRGYIFNIKEGSTNTSLEFNSDIIEVSGGFTIVSDSGANSKITDKSTAIRDFADDATPDISHGTIFATGGTTNITNLDNGWRGKQVTILAEDALDIGGTTNWWLSGDAAFTMANGDALSVIYKKDASTEVLEDTDFAIGTDWDVTGDVSKAGGIITFTFASGSLNGTLKQVNADQAAAAANSSWYLFEYTIAVTIAPDGDFTLVITGDTGEIPNAVTVQLPIIAGTHKVKFISDSAASTGDFTITASETTATKGIFTLDNVSLTRLKWFEVSRFNES